MRDLLLGIAVSASLCGFVILVGLVFQGGRL